MADAAAILAGGRARRLGGVPKGLIRVGDETVIERLRRLLAERCGPVTIIANDPAPYAGSGVPVRADVLPGKGAPGGVHAALAHAAADWVFVAACDLPRLDAATIDRLRAARAGHDAALARAAGRLQPLAGWWHRRAAPVLERLLTAGDPGFAAIVAALDVAVVDFADPDPFTNLNTLEDVAAIGGRLTAWRRG